MDTSPLISLNKIECPGCCQIRCQGHGLICVGSERHQTSKPLLFIQKHTRILCVCLFMVMLGNSVKGREKGKSNLSTHRLTVPSGSRLASGGSNRSSLLQLTLLPTAWTPCALDRSSVQLQALEEASNPGQGSETLGSVAHISKSSISTRRTHRREVPKLGAYIVLRPKLTSAASPPPVIPYLHNGAPSGALSSTKRAEMIAIQ